MLPGPGPVDRGGDEPIAKVDDARRPHAAGLGGTRAVARNAYRSARPVSRVPSRRSAAEKVDLYREHRAEYAASPKPRLQTIGPARYLMAAGRGRPGGPAFQSAIESLYPIAYTLKFRHKALGRDYKVTGLEGFWDAPPSSGRPRARALATLPWRLAMRVPEFVTRTDLTAVRRELATKGRAGSTPVTLERIREGVSAQMLHVGPYSEEHASVRAMETFAAEAGYSLSGPLHEIYLSDPRRVSPTRLKTILRISLKRRRS